MKTLKITGMLIFTIALILSGIWFGWKMSVALFLAFIGNNLEQRNS